MAIATIGAIGTLLGGLSSAAGIFGRNNQQAQDRSNLTLASLQDARNNQAYQQALSALINRRSTAGFEDAFGSSLRYDPATNQWISDLGPLPKAEQTAASQAAVSRNTTDLRQAQLANEMAMRRATAAQPVYDTALRNLAQFRPQTATELSSLLEDAANRANNNVMRPLVSDTLRNFTRTGTGSGDVLAKLGRQGYENLRDSMVQSRIQALSNVDSINNARRQGLEGAATTAASLANPSLQFSGIVPSDQSKTMASLLADRARTASVAPAYGAAGVNSSTELGQKATGAAANAIPDPNFNLNSTTQGISGLASLLTNKDMLSGFGIGGKPKDPFADMDIGFGPGKSYPA